MTLCDAAGYLAASLVVLAFCMEDIVLLRFVAISSNIAFLAYGLCLGLAPVWSLHAVLLPINCWRLCQAIPNRTKFDPGFKTRLDNPGTVLVGSVERPLLTSLRHAADDGKSG